LSVSNGAQRTLGVQRQESVAAGCYVVTKFKLWPASHPLFASAHRVNVLNQSSNSIKIGVRSTIGFGMADATVDAALE
jgi:hypothetical protein